MRIIKTTRLTYLPLGKFILLLPILRCNLLFPFYMFVTDYSFQEVSARVDKFLFDNLVNGDDCWSLGVRNILTSENYVKIRSIRLLGKSTFYRQERCLLMPPSYLLNDHFQGLY